MLQLDFSVVNVALPSIQRELGMPAAELQWIVTGYALAFGAPHDLLQTPPLLISQPPRPDRLSYHVSTPLDPLTTRSSAEAIAATC